LPLPETLWLADIANIHGELTHPTDRDEAWAATWFMRRLLTDEARRGRLRTFHHRPEQVLDIGPRIITPEDFKTDRDAFRDWLMQQGEPLPDWWFPPDDAEPPPPADPEPSDKPAIRPRMPLQSSDPATVVDAAIDTLEVHAGRTPTFAEVWSWLLAGNDTTGIVATAEGRELVLYSKQRMTRETARKAHNRRFR
jgi:hypothetical protein